MRALFVTHKFPPQKGGVGVSALRISEGLASWCESVHVLHATREMAPGMVSSGSLPGGGTVFTMGETDRGAESGQLLETTIRALHERFDYQIVIGFYAVPTGFVAVFTAGFLGLPCVLCLRGNDLDRAIYHGGQLDALRWALQHADAVAAVSRELASKANLLAGRDDVTFLPNSVDSDLFRPLEESRVISRHLVFCGEMRLKKGSEVLLPALAQLSGDWSLTMTGGFRGEAESAYRQWATRHNRAAQRVQLFPYAREPEKLRELYGQADLVLNPALWDGMPNSVLEAMACGRPVLSTRVGGLSDLIRHGETGYLLKLSELGELSRAIESILSDPGRAEIGAAARRHVLAHHRPEQESRAYKDLLESVLARR